MIFKRTTPELLLPENVSRLSEEELNVVINGLLHEVYDNISKDISEVRGVFIHESTVIENKINQIICEHFCKKDETKKAELLHVVLSREGLGLTTKFEILNFILDNYYKNIIERYPTFKAKMSELITFRNDLAHRFFPVETNFQTTSANKEMMFFMEHPKISKGKVTTKKVFITKELCEQKWADSVFIIAVLDYTIQVVKSTE